MQLLGGLFNQGRCETEFHFAPVSGALEMRLHDARASSRTHPHWVSLALSTVLDELAGGSINASASTCIEHVRDLCVADRHYLALQWRLRNTETQQWLTAICPACNTRYDFPLDWRALPTKPAAAQFPLTNVTTSWGEIAVRVPNGRDQEAFAQLPADVDARRWFALRLIVSNDIDFSAFDNNDIDAIESAVEAIAPEVATEVCAQCPECSHEHNVELDIYAALLKPISHLLDDVHRLAAVYHWSEAEILALPSARRRQYLLRIDRARGMTGSVV